MVINTITNDLIVNNETQQISSYNGFINLPSNPNSPSSISLISNPNSLSSSISFIPNPNSLSNTALNTDVDPSDEFSDVILTYINQVLMEENTNYNFDDIYLNNHHPSILATEQPFFDIIGNTFQPPVQNPFNDDINGLLNDFSFGAMNKNSLYNDDINGLVNGFSFGAMDNLIYDSVSCPEPQIEYQSQNNNNNNIINNNSNNNNGQFPYLDKSLFPLVEASDNSISHREIIPNNNPTNKRRKNPHNDDLNLGLETERCTKYFAPCNEETVRELFDKILLCSGHTCELRAPLPNNFKSILNCKVLNKRGRRKKNSKEQEEEEEETIDLTTLLIHCSQAVSIDDFRGANEFLKQIRKHSSPFGNSEQRLAHCFAEGLESRLSGTGSTIYHSLVAKRTTTSDILKAYQLYVTSCPFKKMSHFFSNEVILDMVKNKTKLHIVDYGIYYGFQWPCFMQRLSKNINGDFKLRITGIDLPQPGFKPAERIEETGRRLNEYAKLFNLDFEYRAIAAKWETIRVEDLNLDKNEVLIVNCLYRLRNLSDDGDSVSTDCPRVRVLNTIKKMNPDVFIHGVLNGNFSAPFFVTRFREALFHFATLFDMIEATTSRIDDHRLLIERDLFGREAFNIIACEGSERVERPETYKQWHVKNLNLGFRQLGLKEEIVTKARLKVTKSYHRDFVTDQDKGWLLQGWKGKIIYAISAWKPS